MAFVSQSQPVRAITDLRLPNTEYRLPNTGRRHTICGSGAPMRLINAS